MKIDMDLINSLSLSVMDQIMLYLVFSVMRISGYCYGVFLDAVVIVVKCVIYMIYIE